MQLGKLLHDGRVLTARIEGGKVQPIQGSLADFLHAADPLAAARQAATAGPDMSLEKAGWLAPIDQQEVWAAGVTYIRSKVAREEESASTGGSRFYDMVYTADRPELFFKSPPYRVVHPGQPIRIRRDAKWSVPEPELALVISPALKIVGYTIGNDVSSRDIEGENPLYLPQAKFYDGSCALGPLVTLAGSLPPADQVTINLRITRGEAVLFEGTTKLSAMKRSLEELVSWLGRETSFPHGAVLMTGTGVVPPDDFTLSVGDDVGIFISGIGVLNNRVN